MRNKKLTAIILFVIWLVLIFVMVELGAEI